jgi:hypothetical protein
MMRVGGVSLRAVAANGFAVAAGADHRLEEAAGRVHCLEGWGELDSGISSL